MSRGVGGCSEGWGAHGAMGTFFAATLLCFAPTLRIPHPDPNLHPRFHWAIYGCCGLGPARVHILCVGAGAGVFVQEANVKYLTLETLSRLALNPDILDAIRSHEATITASLRDPDVTIRKCAMDLLFTMCNSSNAEVVVGELLKYLVTADFHLREELVLKIAILAEKFAPSVQWWVWRGRAGWEWRCRAVWGGAVAVGQACWGGWETLHRRWPL